MENFPIDKENIPVHIGIIMDGNGRWAKQQGKKRTVGHSEGLVSAKRIVKAASDLGVKYITLYTFSTENWKRAEEEVSFLMRLISKHLKKEMEFYIQNGIRVVHTGDLAGLPDYLQNEIMSVVNETAAFEHTTVNLAINYGGRDEIIRAVRKWCDSHPEKCADEGTMLSEETLVEYMDQPSIPDPDLIIRSAGEKRLSNFLVWQCAYSELYFSEKLWPDWEADDLYEAIKSYQHRHRKYGA